MKSLHTLFLALALLFSFQVRADQTPASEATIRELMEVTQARSLVENALSQVEGMTQKMVADMVTDKNLPPEVDAVIQRMFQRILKVSREEITWEKLEPDFIALYSESFSQEELEGMLAFYKSPVGQAVNRKMPVLMQKSMLQTQKRMQAMFEKVKLIQEETLSEIRDLKKKGEPCDQASAKAKGKKTECGKAR